MVLGAAAPISPAAATTGSESVRLVASGPSLIHFVVDVPRPEFHPAADSTASGTLELSLDGYGSTMLPGGAALPVRVLTVAVPPSGAVQVEAAALGSDPQRGIRLELAPGTPIPSRMLPRELVGAPGAPPPPARLLDVSWMRNQRVARIAVTPAAYDDASGTLAVCRGIDVRVEVAGGGEPGPPAEDPDPFEGVYRELLVNYEQGKAWRRSQPADRAAPGSGPTRAALSAQSQSVFAGHNWIKIPIGTTGFYRVDFGQIRNFAPFSGDTTTVLDSLRLFSWPGYPVLPESTYCDSCDYREVAIGIVDNGDGRFNRNSDAFYFFGLAASDWADLYDPADRRDTLFVNNPYETRSFYYLTVSTADNPLPGAFRRIAAPAGSFNPTGSEITPATFTARVHSEMDLPNYYYPHVPSIGSTMAWEKWFWQSLPAGNSFFATVDAPGADTTQAARLRARVWGLVRTGVCHAVDVDFNQVPLARSQWNDTYYYPSTLTAPIYISGFTVDQGVSALKSQGNAVRLTVPSGTSCNLLGDQIGVAWFDLFYARRFEPRGNELTFDSPAGAGDYLYRVAPFTLPDRPRVFDVTDPFAPIEMLGFAYDTAGGNYRLSLLASQTGRRRFRIIQDASIVKVATTSISVAPPTSLIDLRSSTNRADYLVIYYDGFKTAADTLSTWRHRFNGFETMTVPISALYDQFSGGRTDPAAIRNFLRTAFRRWEKLPAYVTLLGDASFDFKNYLGSALPGQPGTLVPSYENGFDPAPIIYRQFATDDWLLNVDTATVVVPDFFGGRIPAGDPTTALDVVRNKVLLYERSAPFGEYRNRVMLVADDNLQAAAPDPLGWTHVQQTADLDADTTALPVHMDRAYVYLHTYPTDIGPTKPLARADIRKNLNETGVAFFNYIGHGSPFQMADERVFLNTDVGTLTNATRLPICVAASCDIGKYNDPRVQSLGELMLVQPGGGAIAVVSATEEAFSGQNAALNRNLYRALFARDAGGHYRAVVSEALLASKSGSTNSQKYQLMGDAATRLNLPRLGVALSLWDSTGTQPLSTLVQGRTVMFRGQVLDHPGGPADSLDGVAALLIEDSTPIDYAPGCTPIANCSYHFTAGAIYRGDVAVSGGAFEGRFVVPLEARTGALGRVRAYVSGRFPGSTEEADAVGAVEDSVALGAPPAGDQEGPRITLAFAGGATSVRPDATLRVLLFDPSGILITGHTPQNGIVVTVDDDVTNRVDITPSFRYAAGSYQSGAATFQLPGLAVGAHHIRVTAADNLAAGLNAGAHRSSAAIDFEVSVLPRLRILQAYLFPNPTRSGGVQGGGQFVIDAPGDSVNVLLRIYTVSGRLIRVLRVLGGFEQIQLPWDGLDAEGQRLANGVYLFKVHVNAREADGSSSPRQEAEAEGKLVIVSH